MTKHAARRHRATHWSVPNHTLTRIPFDTTEFDIGSIVSATAGLIVVKQPGVYVITASIRFTTESSTPYNGLFLDVNGVRHAADQRRSATLDMACSTVVLCGEDDEIEA